MNVDEIIRLKKSLTKALEGGKINTVLELMNRLRDNTPSKELLKKTEIGLIIGRQRVHPNPEVAKLAKEIVKKWKDAVSTSKTNDTSNGSTKSAVSESKAEAARNATPKPSPTVNGKPPKRENTQDSLSSTPPDTPTSVDSERRERNFDRDRPPYKNTNVTARDKCVKMLYDSMAFDSNAGKLYFIYYTNINIRYEDSTLILFTTPLDILDSEMILLRATTIEKTVFDQFGRQVVDKYRDKLRGLISNLRDKKNPGLRKRVVDGELQVQDFCTMSKEDMASEEKKARDNEIRQENLFKARGAGPTQAETDMFLCGKCRNRKCTYYQMQTRSADEPMTTFVTCTVCNNRWKAPPYRIRAALWHSIQYYTEFSLTRDLR
ncbi:8533_t:CDS:2 [Dentiscutata erythropus]|uniref:Transcription elongation factor n=1 Tax=Dentiscutata erythropus TaxID=1348616 RepID=A0A9N8VIQ9_9GLOM|nr:8533_t:CDS:2 [Dentiscutata erythropus]